MPLPAVCADKGRADHTKPRPQDRLCSQSGARAQAPLRPRHPGCGLLPRRVSPRTYKAPGGRAALPSPPAPNRTMAAPSSSLASSSHLSRRGAAAVVPSSPLQSQPQLQLLRYACSARHPPRVRCSWAGGRATSSRRMPGVCFVVSPSQPGGPCLWFFSS